MNVVDVEPGKVNDVALNFEELGIYTFYCTRWCGLNHWRMRGTIEVTGASNLPKPTSPPLYISLNIDIDAPHDAPNSSTGQALGSSRSVIGTG